MTAAVEAVMGLVRLAGFDEFELRAARCDVRTRSWSAAVLVFALSSDPHMLSRERASQMEALPIVLAMPLVIEPIHAAALKPFAAIAAYEWPYPLYHWLFLAIAGSPPAEQPPLAGVDVAWLDRVITAHADAPWVLRLLAARAEAA